MSAHLEIERRVTCEICGANRLLSQMWRQERTRFICRDEADCDVYIPGWWQHPFIESERVKPLWRLSTWDGVTTGICEVDGEPCFFDWACELGQRRDRPMVCYKLTSEQWVAFQDRNRIWEERIGTHQRYEDGDWSRRGGSVRPDVPNWKEYWDETLRLMGERPALPSDQIIGYFMH